MGSIRLGQDKVGVMRILQIIHDFVPETTAGAEVYTHNLSVALVGKGHEVFVFCRGWNLQNEPYTVRDEAFDGLRVRRVDFGTAGQQPYYRRHDAKMDHELKRYLAEVQPDVVHIHHMRYLSTDIVRIIKDLDIPVLITTHDMAFHCPVGTRLYHDETLCYREASVNCLSCYWPDSLSRKRKYYPWQIINPALIKMHEAGMGSLIPQSAEPSRILDSLATWREEYRSAYMLADAVHSPSQFLGDMVVDAGVPQERVHVVENSIDYTPGSALPKKPSPYIRFGQIGKSKLKGTHIAVQAMKHLPYEAAELRIYGGISGSYREELDALAPGAHIQMLGSFERSALAEVFSEIDVLIVPSIWFENCPAVIREAFANNTPVVTANVGGMAESVRDGVDGLHFEFADPVDLGRKLRRFIDEPTLVEHLRQNIKLPPTAEMFTSQIEAIYQQLVGIEGRINAQ